MKSIQLPREAWIAYGILLACVLLYVGLSYFAPARSSRASLGLSETVITLLRLSITLPAVLAWVLAFYGLVTLRQYLQVTREQDNKFVPVLRAIYSGLGWIIFSMIGAVILSSLRAYFTARPDVISLLTILTNYLYVFPVLVGFFLMYQGMKHLRVLPHRRSEQIIKTLMVLLIVAFYVFLVFTNPSRQVATGLDMRATYYLPDMIIIFTMIIPIFISWWLGFSVAFALSDLIPNVTRAALFKAMTRMLYGIWSIIFTSILLQALLSLGSARLMAIGLGLTLVLVYILLILYGMGYLFMALGVRTLKKTSLATQT